MLYWLLCQIGIFNMRKRSKNETFFRVWIINMWRSNIIMNISSWVKIINCINHIFHQHVELDYFPRYTLLSSMFDNQWEITVYWLKYDCLRVGIHEWIVWGNYIAIDQLMKIWWIELADVLVCMYLVLDIEKWFIREIFEIPNNHAEVFLLFLR